MIQFKPIKNETVVVVDENGKVLGTIKRYKQWKRCIVSIPGILSPSANPGEANFSSIRDAKKEVLKRHGNKSM